MILIVNLFCLKEINEVEVLDFFFLMIDGFKKFI